MLKLYEDTYVIPVPGVTLIVGSRIYDDKEDRRHRYQNAIGVDLLDGPGVDIVANLEKECGFTDLFSHVDCLSVLEHSKRPWDLCKNIESKMHIGASIYVTVPFIWRLHAYPDDYWRFTASGLKQLFEKIEWENISYVSQDRITKKTNISSIESGGLVYMQRTEVCAFGHRI